MDFRNIVLGDKSLTEIIRTARQNFDAGADRIEIDLSRPVGIRLKTLSLRRHICELILLYVEAEFAQEPVRVGIRIASIPAGKARGTLLDALARCTVVNEVIVTGHSAEEIEKMVAAVRDRMYITTHVDSIPA